MPLSYYATFQLLPHFKNFVKEEISMKKIVHIWLKIALIEDLVDLRKTVIYVTQLKYIYLKQQKWFLRYP